MPDPVQNFLAIAIFVADGAYNFVKIGVLSLEASSLLPTIPIIPFLELTVQAKKEGCVYTYTIWMFLPSVSQS